MSDTEQKKDKYTKTELKELGFTEKLIQDLLLEPEYHKSPRGAGRFYYLWRADDVKKAMLDERFIATQEKRKERSTRAQKVADKKRKKTMDKVNNIISDMTPPERIELDELKECAIQYKNDDFICQDRIADANNADEDTIKRWIVNYIRHEMTDYNFEVVSADMEKCVGRDEAFILFEKKVYENIALVYPELADECDRQLQRKIDKRNREWGMI